MFTNSLIVLQQIIVMFLLILMGYVPVSYTHLSAATGQGRLA